MRSIFIAAIAALAVPASQAAEKPTELKQGAGLEKVAAYCNTCHSLDYIPMNSRFLETAGWEAEVAKMINAFGAPIDQADAKAIAEYLRTNYGPQTAGAAAAKGDSEPQRHRLVGVRPKRLAPSSSRAEPGLEPGARGGTSDRVGRD
jgi:mono/diheme cytochrome c family protein